jgi:hypothetical protein
MNISEFERGKPIQTHKLLTRLIKKYKKIVDELPLMDDEDAIKVEMSADFIRELTTLKKTFEKGQRRVK